MLSEAKSMVPSESRPIRTNAPTYFRYHLGERSLAVTLNYWNERLENDLCRRISPLTNIFERHAEKMERIAWGIQGGSVATVLGAPLVVISPETGYLSALVLAGVMTLGGVIIGTDLYDGKISED